MLRRDGNDSRRVIITGCCVVVDEYLFYQRLNIPCRCCIMQLIDTSRRYYIEPVIVTEAGHVLGIWYVLSAKTTIVFDVRFQYTIWELG